MVPGKSAELNSTCEPGRSRAWAVNGANTPRSRTARRRSGPRRRRWQALEVDVVLGQPDRGEALQEQEVVDHARLGRDRCGPSGPRSR